MCLILIAYQAHPRYPLVIAANRDEFHARETAPAHWWTDEPVLAGRDLEAGGTWLGVNPVGGFAAVTNFRDPSVNEPGSPSRGELPLHALRDGVPGGPTLRWLEANAARYNGFNLLFGSAERVHYISNRAGEPGTLRPGISGLSNHLLETPWPKVERGKMLLKDRLDEADELDQPRLLDMLHDRERPDDAHLPDTGIALEWERLLAPMFIISRRYGTRASTVVTVDGDGEVVFAERTFDWRGEPDSENRYCFHIRDGY